MDPIRTARPGTAHKSLGFAARTSSLAAPFVPSPHKTIRSEKHRTWDCLMYIPEYFRVSFWNRSLFSSKSKWKDFISQDHCIVSVTVWPTLQFAGSGSDLRHCPSPEKPQGITWIKDIFFGQWAMQIKAYIHITILCRTYNLFYDLSRFICKNIAHERQMKE